MAELNMWGDYVKLQADLPVVKEDAKNPHFGNKYASLDGMQTTVFPILTKHNFGFLSRPSAFESTGDPSLKYALIHTSGEAISGEMPLLLKSHDPQSQGSAITYARRYALGAVLGLSTGEDDDGQRATATAKTGAVPITWATRGKLRQAFADAGITGDAATDFIQTTINKPIPQTETDADVLIKALAKRKDTT